MPNHQLERQTPPLSVDPSLQSLAKTLKHRCLKTNDIEKVDQSMAEKSSRSHFSAQSIVQNLENELEKNTRSADETYHDSLLKANQKILNNFYNERGLRPNFQTKPSAPPLLPAASTSAYDLHRRLEKGDSSRQAYGLTNLRGVHSAFDERTNSTNKSQQSGKEAIYAPEDFKTFQDYVEYCRHTRTNSNFPSKTDFTFKKLIPETKQFEQAIAGHVENVETNVTQSIRASPDQSSPHAHPCSSKVSSHSFWTNNLSDMESKKTFKPNQQQSLAKLSTFLNYINPLGKKQKNQEPDAERRGSNWSMQIGDREPFYLENQPPGSRKHNKIDLLKYLFVTKKKAGIVKDFNTGVSLAQGSAECNDENIITTNLDGCVSNGKFENSHSPRGRDERSQRSLSPDSLIIEKNACTTEFPSLESRHQQDTECALEAQGHRPRSASSASCDSSRIHRGLQSKSQVAQSMSGPQRGDIRQTNHCNTMSSRTSCASPIHLELQSKSQIAQSMTGNAKKAYYREIYHCSTLSSPSRGSSRGVDSDLESSISIRGETGCSQYCTSESYSEHDSKLKHLLADCNRRKASGLVFTHGQDRSRAENNLQSFITETAKKVESAGKPPIFTLPAVSISSGRKILPSQITLANCGENVEELSCIQKPGTVDNLQSKVEETEFKSDKESIALKTSTPEPKLSFANQIKERLAFTENYCNPAGSATGWSKMEKSAVGETIRGLNYLKIVDTPDQHATKMGTGFSKMPTFESTYSTPRPNTKIVTSPEVPQLCVPSETTHIHHTQSDWRSMARSDRYQTGSSIFQTDRNQFFETKMPLSSCPSVISSTKKSPRIQNDSDSCSESIVINEEIPKYSRFAPWYKDWLASRKSRTNAIGHQGPSKTLRREVVEQIRLLVALPVEVQQKLARNEENFRRKRR